MITTWFRGELSHLNALLSPPQEPKADKGMRRSRGRSEKLKK
jgi:hypothetical protein